MKNRPEIDQILCWIAPEESPDNALFVQARKEEFPGELRVVSIEDAPGHGEGHFFLTISHNRETIMDKVDESQTPSKFSPFWFHWEGE